MSWHILAPLSPEYFVLNVCMWLCRYFSETKEEPLIVEIPQDNIMVDNTSAGCDNSQENQKSHQAEEDVGQKSELVQEVREIF